jgi:TonB family protein
VSLTKSLSFTLVFLGWIQLLSASDHDLEQQLKQQYVGKTLILRQPVEKDSQQYDSDGKLLSGGREGSWTLYGGVVIKNVTLGQDQLLIEGDRALFKYDRDRDEMVTSRGDGHVTLEIHLDRPCDSREQADAIFKHIFAMTDRDLYDRVPDYWKPYVAKRAEQKMKRQRSAGRAADATGSKTGNPGAFPDSGPDLSRLPNLAALTKGVTPPEALHTPWPGYTRQAEKRHLEGEVVLLGVIAEDGRVLFPRIMRPLGLGLDEKAIEDVSQWKFKPAMQHGKPVKVTMALEITFRLF